MNSHTVSVSRTALWTGRAIGVYPGPVDTDMVAGLDIEKETPQRVAWEICKAIESGAEEVYPDKVALDVAAKLKSDAKGLEKEWSGMLPQPVEV